jgi:hypothetical protein
MECIRRGFYSVVPMRAAVMLSPMELELLVCGHPTVDVEVCGVSFASQSLWCRLF